MKRLIILLFSVFGIFGLYGQNAALLTTVPSGAAPVVDTFLLDSFPGVAAAYYVNCLKYDHLDSAAIRVRRSSDNAEQDIGFTAQGYLDTASMKTFVGANSGYVVTWYDQSGNEKDATQATAANQPRIVLNGTIARMNGQPTIYSYASLIALDTNIPFNGNKWGFCTARMDNSSSFSALIGSKGSNLGRMVVFRNSGAEKAIDQYYSSGFAVRTNNFQYLNNTNYVLSFSKSHTSALNYFYLNGSEVAYTERNTRSDYTSTIQLFNSGDSANWYGLYSNLILIYDTDQSSNRANLENAINRRLQFY